MYVRCSGACEVIGDLEVEEAPTSEARGPLPGDIAAILVPQARLPSTGLAWDCLLQALLGAAFESQ